MLLRPNYQKVIKSVDNFVNNYSLTLSPPIDVEKACKKIGITVVRTELKEDVSGFLFMDKKSQPIIGINKEHSLTRQRFTIAHELGHFLLHANRGEENSFIDKSFFIANRNSKSSSGISEKEIEANFFAAEILMPGQTLYPDFVKAVRNFGEEKAPEHLAESYRVSVEAMKFRLSNLGFISF